MPIIIRDGVEAQADLSAPSQSLVSQKMPKWFETNKMRYFLQAVHASEGMATKHMYHMEFYSGLALWIENTFNIAQDLTDKYWTLFPKRMFKEVYIWKVALNWDEWVAQKELEFGVGATKDLPILGIIGQGALDMSDKARFSRQLSSIQHYPIWENVGYKHTISNEVLHANWQKAKLEIAPFLEKKYGGQT